MLGDVPSYYPNMLDYTLSPYESTLTIRLHSAVSEADVLLLIPKVDKYLEHHKRLAGRVFSIAKLIKSSLLRLQPARFPHIKLALHIGSLRL